MHDDDRPVGPDLARRLIAAEMPDLAGLPLRPVASAGTDNVLYRLGERLVLRFPRAPWAGALIAKEAAWLPVLAPHLPLPIPRPGRLGRPALGYPYPWSVIPWLPGQDLQAGPVPDQPGLARELAAFVRALQAVDPGLAGDSPPQGRGAPLAARDGFIRSMIGRVTDEGDPAEWTAFWDQAMALPDHAGPAVWLHGDLHGANLLARDGRLSAVIDWGCLGLGDPAYDLTPAWTLFDPPARAVFRAALDADDATWARARALAGSGAMGAIPYYRSSNPGLMAIATVTLARVLDDWRQA
jgi:aminoglycoside phosphotransferase (APT) family kinase protein